VVTDLFRDEKSGALVWAFFGAIFAQEHWSMALVGLRSSSPFLEVAHDTHAKAIRAAVSVLESAASTHALVGSYEDDGVRRARPRRAGVLTREAGRAGRWSTAWTG
jgi:hypothetical protein